MSDFLAEKKDEIRSRMEEIKPLVDEYHRLEAAHAALDGVSAQPVPAAARSRKPSGPPSGGGGRGRPKGSGTRAKEALELVRSRPGITIPEIAEAMGMKQNYLYRVMPDLQKSGDVRKEGRGWFANEAAA